MKCSICTSEHRAAVEDCLVKGVTYERISSQYGFGGATISRHVHRCMIPYIRRKAFTTNKSLIDGPQIFNGLTELGILYGFLKEDLAAAREVGNHSLVCRYLDRMHKNLEIQEKFLRKMHNAKEVEEKGNEAMKQFFEAIDDLDEIKDEEKKADLIKRFLENDGQDRRDPKVLDS